MNRTEKTTEIKMNRTEQTTETNWKETSTRNNWMGGTTRNSRTKVLRHQTTKLMVCVNTISKFTMHMRHQTLRMTPVETLQQVLIITHRLTFISVIFYLRKILKKTLKMKVRQNIAFYLK